MLPERRREGKQTNPKSSEQRDARRHTAELWFIIITSTHTHTHCYNNWRERASDNTTPRSDLHVCEGQICTFHSLHTRSLSVIICRFTDAAADHTDQHQPHSLSWMTLKRNPHKNEAFGKTKRTNPKTQSFLVWLGVSNEWKMWFNMFSTCAEGCRSSWSLKLVHMKRSVNLQWAWLVAVANYRVKSKTQELGLGFIYRQTALRRSRLQYDVTADFILTISP